MVLFTAPSDYYKNFLSVHFEKLVADFYLKSMIENDSTIYIYIYIYITIYNIKKFKIIKISRLSIFL